MPCDQAGVPALCLQMGKLRHRWGNSVMEQVSGKAAGDPWVLTPMPVL